MASDFPLISVIIPAYNSANFLIETLESALAQTWPNKEIIVVNDGSTDETDELLKAYRERICYIFQENGGLGAARNSGLRAAKGELVAFLDADDLWLPEFLETQARFLIQNPNVGVVYSWWDFIDPGGAKLPQEGRFTETGNLLRHLVLSNRFAVMSALIRMKCVEAVGGFDADRLISEDWDFWVRVAQTDCVFGLTPRVLSQYRMHGTNMSWNIPKSHRRYIRVLDKVFEHENGQVADLKPRAYSGVLLLTATSYLRAGMTEDGKGAFLAGVKTWPELVCQEDTYYKIICLEQPLGYQGTQNFKDLEKAKARIAELFEHVSNEPDLRTELAPLVNRAFAVQRIALAKHYYLAGQCAEARSLIQQAAKVDPPSVQNRETMGLWIRSLLGKKQVDRIKRTAAFRKVKR
jgi:glycosyltransferase involved in cell wall biosynthesis